MKPFLFIVSQIYFFPALFFFLLSTVCSIVALLLCAVGSFRHCGVSMGCDSAVEGFPFVITPLIVSYTPFCQHLSVSLFSLLLFQSDSPHKILTCTSWHRKANKRVCVQTVLSHSSATPFVQDCSNCPQQPSRPYVEVSDRTDVGGGSISIPLLFPAEL